MATLERPQALPPIDSPIRESTEDRIFKRIFLSPAVTILLILSIFPLIWSLAVSLTNCQRSVPQGNEVRSFVGDLICLGNPANISLENFVRAFSDARLMNAAKNTLFFVIMAVTVQYVIGMGLALLLNREFVGRRFFRLIFLLPMMMTPVAVGYVGRMMFDSGISPLAQFQRTIGTFLTGVLGQKVTISIPFLTDPAVAPFTIVLMDSWQWIPFMTLLLLAGMQAIPDEIYEAARVDGARSWQIFWSMTFPILLPISLTAILIRCLETFKIIDVINVVTGGGPGSATESLAMYVYDTALTYGNYSYASTIGLVLLVVIILFATVFLTISRRLTK